ncbi:MAG: hypothetical protein Q4D39_08005, partial [Coriobacteriaceae bacterium]|nr:hypothetical protein [Coriobacteriaceae bacterium]
PNDPLFSDHVTLERYDADHNLVSTTPGTLTAFALFVQFTPDASPDEPVCVGLDQVVGLGIFLRNTLIAHIGRHAKHFEVRGERGFNALKYRYFYKAVGK